MTPEEQLYIFKYIKKHGKPPQQYFSIADYARIHFYIDKVGGLPIKKGNFCKSLSPQRIYQKLDKKELFLTNVKGVFGEFIDVYKYPPIFNKRGAKRKRRLDSKELEAFIEETLKVSKGIESREDFKIYVQKRYEIIKNDINKDLFLNMIMNYKKSEVK